MSTPLQWPAVQAVLIDLDGTLLDSIPDLAHAANAMRVEMALEPLRQDVIATFVGKGVENLICRTLAGSLIEAEPDPQTFDRAREAFFRHYHVVNGERSTLYPDVIEGLKALRNQSLKLAVVTNKPETFTLPLLQRAGLAGFFEVVVSGDTCAKKKPDPEPMLHACNLLGVNPQAAIAIGDSINDVQAARSAGMRVLAVPYGYNEGMDVRGLETDGIVTTLLDAAHWIASTNDTVSPTEFQ